MPKPTRTAAELQRMLLERMATVRDLAGQETDVHRGGVRWVDPGEGGPNWTVPVLSERTIHRSDIARFIRELQMRFDLEE